MKNKYLIYTLCAYLACTHLSANAQTPQEQSQEPAASVQEQPVLTDQSNIDGNLGGRSEHIYINDGRVEINEIRQRGETQSIEVNPQGRAPTYEVTPRNSAPTEDRSAGQSRWRVLSF